MLVLALCPAACGGRPATEPSGGPAAASAGALVNPTCGRVELGNVGTPDPGVQAALSCFAQASAACRAASIGVTVNGVDTRNFDELTIDPANSCQVVVHDRVWFNNSAPEQMVDYYCLTALLPRGRLVLHGCTDVPEHAVTDVTL